MNAFFRTISLKYVIQIRCTYTHTTCNIFYLYSSMSGHDMYYKVNTKIFSYWIRVFTPYFHTAHSSSWNTCHYNINPVTILHLHFNVKWYDTSDHLPLGNCIETRHPFAANQVKRHVRDALQSVACLPVSRAKIRLTHSAPPVTD